MRTLQFLCSKFCQRGEWDNKEQLEFRLEGRYLPFFSQLLYYNFLLGHNRVL